jgi:hypothetical protein
LRTLVPFFLDVEKKMKERIFEHSFFTPFFYRLDFPCKITCFTQILSFLALSTDFFVQLKKFFMAFCNFSRNAFDEKSKFLDA